MIRSPAAHDGRRFLAGFALLSLLAVAIGCAVAAANGVPAGLWARNVGAWVVGAAVAWLIGRRTTRLSWFLLAAPVGIAATLAHPGLQGVHRWVAIGPLRLNAAAILVPAAAVALAVLAGRGWSWLAAAVTLALLVMQPDASQATAFGAAMLVILASLRAPVMARAGGAAAVVLGVAAAWLRPDPLAPVPEVEGIIGLAAGAAPVAVASLAVTALIPLLMAGRTRAPALALAACLAATALAPALGAFPVPLVGMGVSPILGFWLGAGALAAANRAGSGARAG